MTSSLINGLSLTLTKNFCLSSLSFQYNHQRYLRNRNTTRQYNSKQQNTMSQNTQSNSTLNKSTRQTQSQNKFNSRGSTIRYQSLQIRKENKMKNSIQQRKLVSIIFTNIIFNHQLNRSIQTFILNIPPIRQEIVWRSSKNLDQTSSNKKKQNNRINQG